MTDRLPLRAMAVWGYPAGFAFPSGCACATMGPGLDMDLGIAWAGTLRKSECFEKGHGI